MSFAPDNDCLYTFMFSVHHAEYIYAENAENCGTGVGAYFCHLENGYQLDQSIDNSVSGYDDCCKEDEAQGCP